MTEEFMVEMLLFTLRRLIPIRYDALNIYLMNRQVRQVRQEKKSIY
ncbi:hypothetical protein NIES22_32430 [Calothrix brevissima NIES-22]|nr:hypothetical protein NIES22_32430 [Calothrix brevissima NIES-22]